MLVGLTLESTMSVWNESLHASKETGMEVEAFFSFSQSEVNEIPYFSLRGNFPRVEPFYLAMRTKLLTVSRPIASRFELIPNYSEIEECSQLFMIPLFE